MHFAIFSPFLMPIIIWLVLYVLEAFNTTTVVYFAILAYLLTLWSYGISFSGGVLIPGLCTGAAWGRLVGLGILQFFPNTVYYDIIILHLIQNC